MSKSKNNTPAVKRSGDRWWGSPSIVNLGEEHFLLNKTSDQNIKEVLLQAKLRFKANSGRKANISSKTTKSGNNIQTEHRPKEEYPNSKASKNVPKRESGSPKVTKENVQPPMEVISKKKIYKRDVLLESLLAPLNSTTQRYLGGVKAVGVQGGISLCRFVDIDYITAKEQSTTNDLITNFPKLTSSDVFRHLRTAINREYLIPTYKQTTRFTYVKRLSHVKRICRVTGQVTMIDNLEWMKNGFYMGKMWVSAKITYINHSYMIVLLTKTKGQGIGTNNETVISDGSTIGILGYRVHVEGSTTQILPNNLIDKISTKLAFRERNPTFLAQVVYYAGKYATSLKYELVHSDLMLVTKLLLKVKTEIMALHSGLYESDAGYKEHANLLKLKRTKMTLPNFFANADKVGLMCESTAQYVKSVIKTVVQATNSNLGDMNEEELHSVRDKVMLHLGSLKLNLKKRLNKVGGKLRKFSKMKLEKRRNGRNLRSSNTINSELDMERGYSDEGIIMLDENTGDYHVELGPSYEQTLSKDSQRAADELNRIMMRQNIIRNKLFSDTKTDKIKLDDSSSGDDDFVMHSFSSVSGPEELPRRRNRGIFKLSSTAIKSLLAAKVGDIRELLSKFNSKLQEANRRDMFRLSNVFSVIDRKLFGEHTVDKILKEDAVESAFLVDEDPSEDFC